MAIDWNKIDTYVDETVIPVLNEYGAKNIQKLYPFDEPERGSAWPPLLTFQFKNEQIRLNTNEIQKIEQKPVKSFLKYFDRFVKVEEELRCVSSPFYSDIYNNIKSEFGTRTTIDTTLGYRWVCDKIRASGRRIWS